jgi:hypothetical protein
MATLKRSGLVWSLLACLVLANALMAAPSVGHTIHHAHHQAGTHAGGLCAWLCAAGQGIETFTIHVDAVAPAGDRIPLPEPGHPFESFSFPVFLRGPPPLSR